MRKNCHKKLDNHENYQKEEKLLYFRQRLIFLDFWNQRRELIFQTFASMLSNTKIGDLNNAKRKGLSASQKFLNSNMHFAILATMLFPPCGFFSIYLSIRSLMYINQRRWFYNNFIKITGCWICRSYFYTNFNSKFIISKII